MLEIYKLSRCTAFPPSTSSTINDQQSTIATINFATSYSFLYLNIHISFSTRQSISTLSTLPSRPPSWGPTVLTLTPPSFEIHITKPFAKLTLKILPTWLLLSTFLSVLSVQLCRLWKSQTKVRSRKGIWYINTRLQRAVVNDNQSRVKLPDQSTMLFESMQPETINLPVDMAHFSLKSEPNNIHHNTILPRRSLVPLTIKANPPDLDLRRDLIRIRQRAYDAQVL